MESFGIIASIKLAKRGLVQLCTTDGWAPEAQEHDLGRRCLHALLGQPGWTVRILTKNAVVAKDFDLVGQHRDRVLVGLSLTAPPRNRCGPLPRRPNATVHRLPHVFRKLPRSCSDDVRSHLGLHRWKAGQEWRRKRRSGFSVAQCFSREPAGHNPVSRLTCRVIGQQLARPGLFRRQGVRYGCGGSFQTGGGCAISSRRSRYTWAENGHNAGGQRIVIAILSARN
jgi:hypothetical protein